MAEMTTEWGLIVVTREGVALIPQAEICPSLAVAKERARQERSFGMNVFIAKREVTEWEPMGITERSNAPRHTPAPKCAGCGHFLETHDGFGCAAINCTCPAPVPHPAATDVGEADRG